MTPELSKESAEILEAFLQHLRVDRGVSPRTLTNYRLDILSFLGYLKDKDKKLASVSREDLTEYLWHKKSQGLQPASLARYIACLRTFFTFLVGDERVTSDPASLLRTPRKAERLPRYLTVEEVARLLTGVGSAKDRDVRLRAMLEVMYAAGLRVSELTGLRLDGVDFKRGCVRVMGKGGKERVVPIGERARLAVQGYLDRRPVTPASVKTLFVSDRKGPMSAVQFWRLIRQAAIQVGIQKPVTPHTLRHSFASHLVQNGADLRAVQEMLGHSSISTTQIYTHVGQSHLQDAHRKFHPRA